MLIDLFFQGGVLFMSVLTLLFIAAIIVAIVNGRSVLGDGQAWLADKRAKLSYTHRKLVWDNLCEFILVAIKA